VDRSESHSSVFYRLQKHLLDITFNLDFSSLTVYILQKNFLVSLGSLWAADLICRWRWGVLGPLGNMSEYKAIALRDSSRGCA
jgi:hypothetical protein